MTPQPPSQKDGVPSGGGASGQTQALSGLSSVRPMDAVTILYSHGNEELTEAIVASLSHGVFEGTHGGPASPGQRTFARLSYRVLKLTTSRRKCTGGDYEGGAFHNPILVWSKHPYARAMMDSSRKETENLVEGGDPMNGPYMMISREILAGSDVWDRIFLHSVQGKDVQLRFISETRATYEAVKRRLGKGENVRLKAVAAGTGLSMILAYDRMMKEGLDLDRLSVRITDRDQVNVEKMGRLLAKLTSTRSRVTKTKTETPGTISIGTEDLFEGEPGSDTTGEAKFHIVTSIGILDYLQGFTCGTTEQIHGLPHSEESVKAEHLAARLGHMVAAGGELIVNTYRPDPSTRILELFGRKFRYRNQDNLSALLATANFGSPRTVGSGNMYDVVVYEKSA